MMSPSWIKELKFNKKWRVVAFIGGGGKTTTLEHLATELAEKGHSVLITTTTKIWYPQNPDYSVVLRETTVVSQSYSDLLKNTCQKGRIVVAGERVSEEGKLIGLSCETLKEIKDHVEFDVMLIEADGSKGRSLKAYHGQEPVIPEFTDFCYIILGCDVFGKPLTEKWVHRAEHFSRITGTLANEKISPELVASYYMKKNGYADQIPAKQGRALVLTKTDTLPGYLGALKLQSLLNEHVQIVRAPHVEKLGRGIVAGVLLAAGSGSRFNEVQSQGSDKHGGKLLHRLLGRTQIEWVTAAALSSELIELMVVYSDERITEILRKAYPVAIQNRRLRFVENKIAKQGQSTSVKAGLTALESSEAEGYMFLMADQLLLDPETLDELLSNFKPGHMVVPINGAQQGAPVIFSSVFVEELMAISGDKGGREIIKNHPERVIGVNVTAEALMDVDTQEDLDRMMLPIE